MMVVSQIGNVISSPIIGDMPKIQYIYLFIIVALFVIGLIITILCNLSEELRRKKGVILIPLMLYAVAFLMVVLFPRIYGYETINIFS